MLSVLCSPLHFFCEPKRFVYLSAVRHTKSQSHNQSLFMDIHFNLTENDSKVKVWYHLLNKNALQLHYMAKHLWTLGHHTTFCVFPKLLPHSRKHTIVQNAVPLQFTFTEGVKAKPVPRFAKVSVEEPTLSAQSLDLSPKEHFCVG